MENEKYIQGKIDAYKEILQMPEFDRKQVDNDLKKFEIQLKQIEEEPGDFAYSFSLVVYLIFVAILWVLFVNYKIDLIVGFVLSFAIPVVPTLFLFSIINSIENKNKSFAEKSKNQAVSNTTNQN